VVAVAGLHPQGHKVLEGLEAVAPVLEVAHLCKLLAPQVRSYSVGVLEVVQITLPQP
jgi:hypothetical protein